MVIHSVDLTAWTTARIRPAPHEQLNIPTFRPDSADMINMSFIIVDPISFETYPVSSTISLSVQFCPQSTRMLKFHITSNFDQNVDHEWLSVSHASVAHCNCV